MTKVVKFADYKKSHDFLEEFGYTESVKMYKVLKALEESCCLSIFGSARRDTRL